MGSRKHFTPEFKREAVHLLESGSRPASEIARELDMARNRLYKGQTELRARGSTAFPGPGYRKERTTEIARLKRELTRVTEERDILKKAAAFFARASQRDTALWWRISRSLRWPACAGSWP